MTRMRADRSAVLSRSHLDLPCAGADPVLAEVVGGHADTILGRLSPENPLSHLVRRAISLSLAEGPTLDGVAATMHTSGRTLRRRLASAGTSFQQLLDEVRAELARRYLRDHRLSSGKPCDRNPIRRTAHIVETDPMTEFHRRRLTAVLTADSKLQIGASAAPFLACHLH